MGPLIVRMLSIPGAIEAVLCAENRPPELEGEETVESRGVT